MELALDSEAQAQVFASLHRTTGALEAARIVTYLQCLAYERYERAILVCSVTNPDACSVDAISHGNDALLSRYRWLDVYLTFSAYRRFVTRRCTSY